MNLHDTSINKIYYKTSDSKTIAITIPKKIYFVWNKYQREMIAIYGITLSTDYDLISIINEYIQSVIQEYEFTIRDNIYEKNNKYYKYNNEALKFDEIPYKDDYSIQCFNNDGDEFNHKCVIGENEKCRACDLNHSEFCGTCNEGYYLPQYDKTKCK